MKKDLEKRKKKPGIAITVFLYILAGLFLMAGRAVLWAKDQASLNLDEILYTITRPLNGTDSGIIFSLISFVVLWPVVFLAIFGTIRYFMLRSVQKNSSSNKLFSVIAHRMLPACALISVIFGSSVLVYAWNTMEIGDYIRNSSEESTWIEDHYVDPGKTKITFPGKKRNLIYLYLESMEVSYSDRESGGMFEENYIPNLTELGLEAEDFSGSGGTKLNGASSWKYTTWTMGGMFAATSGLVLKIPLEMDGVDTNYMSTQDSFFSSITTLGDILQKQGYVNDLLIGSDATFGGRRLYFSEHGDYEFHDYNYYSENGFLPSGYKVFWGFEDEKLFKAAKERLAELSVGEKPFNLTILTVDTHYPNGYQCRLCEDTYSSPYANSIVCSDRQAAQFLDWCKEQDWYEDTVIVVSGDHPTMATFCDGADEDYVRKVYTAYLNSSVEAARDDWREYSTVDNFPTTLAAMGAKIEGDRLGLGTNLFSSLDTLTETVGREAVDEELSKASRWMESQADVEPVTAKITYDPCDEENHVLSFTIRDVSSDKVDGFRCCMRMYGYSTASSKDYIKWISATHEEDGSWRAEWTLPVDHAYEGIVKLQPTCMVDGARSNVLDLHYYYLKYDEGGENFDWYECDSRGRRLDADT